jgi:hypothetical protein
MHAARAPRRGPLAGRTPRLICVAAGLLCTLGILTGAAVRSSEVAHHRHHALAAATVVVVGPTTLREDHHAVASTPPPLTSDSTRVAVETGTATSVHTAELDSVRTRGPPSV